jgi:DNA repair protein RadC
MALAAFQSDQQALDFLYGGPVADPQLNIAPEAPVEMELGPDRMIQAADAAFLDDLDARGEPRLPQEDEDLPPVVPAEQPQAPAPFASDEEALAFLSAGAEERRVETPRPTLEAGQTSVPGFGSDEEALAFLQGAEQRAPEIKLPAPRPTPKPVTTPEAADGTDVTFEKDGPAFQFTGSLVVDPSSGPEQGLDGMVPAAARGPVATMPGQAEPVLNRRPRLVPSEGGQIVFDQSSPERFTQGVEEAFAAGILPASNYEKIKASEAQIFKVVDDRRKLEEKAQADPRLLAVLQGAGRGGAMTVGAVGGAKLLAAAGALTGPAAPIAVPVLGVTGAIAGGIGAGLGYDALYKTLGNHFEEYDNVMKAAELFPMHKAGGEMGMVALALPVSVAQGARGLRTAFQDGGLPQVARTAGTAAGLGAGTGVVAYPIDAAVRGEEITPGGFAAAAGVGALTGGFFLNNRMAGAKDVAAVAAKMKAGTPLTAAETKLAQAAQPAISAAIARMDTAGGVRTGPLEVEVPMTSVAGLVPSVGRAAARVPYRVPVKLPAGAVARAKADVPQALPAPGKTAAADAPVPRTAPVNVLPSGTVTIPMPGPAPAAAVAVPRAVSAAMAEPFNWALDTANERGIDLEETETDNWNALLSEHLQIVKSAIDAGEPVSVKAFQVYDLSVPFYDLDPATGTATLNAQTLRDYEEYLGGQDADYRESMAAAGAEELLAAVIDLGGLPAPKSGAKRAVWSGELKALFEAAKGAGKGKGGDNQKGVFINKLFRRDGMDLDEMAMALKAKGFRVETEADLIELLGNRLRSGREIFGMATQSMEDVPLEMRGTRRAAGPGPRQMDLLGEQDVEFGLMGQTDARSLTPQELAARAEAEAAAAAAEAAQTDLFGGRVEERPDLTLAPPDPQAYFDFSNVPASKQPAGNAAVQAAVQASDQPYQAAPVSAAGGVAGDVGLADARARQAAAYRALLGGNAAAVADAIKNGVPLSRLMLGFITRESAPFNIKGAIIKSPQDLAMYNLAHRTPFFESLKIAVLDDREQVVHSQVVSQGSLNESIAHPRDFAAVVLAAQQANPKAKLIGFMIMHNHPSGDPTPSDADRAVTRRFREVGDLIGMPLLDHVITNGETYFSFMEGGMLSVSAPVKLARADAKPRLPVLPAPEGRMAPGARADFEAVPASEAVNVRLSNENRVKMIHQTLQTADPNMIHVVNVDTRYGILSVVRHPMDVRPADVIKATTPQGAYAMFVSLPAMPPADARPLVRRIREAADLLNIYFLDAAMTGETSTFKEQGLLEMPDAPYAVSSRAMEPPGSLSSDPLTPPASVRSGGGTQVPPGAIPVGMAALQTPDWVLARGETSAGRRLIKGVENFRPGQRWGFRSIVDFVNEAVRLEMRRSTTQTSRTHPAHYKPANHVAYTRETQSQINFHEAGHGLEYLLRARLPDVFVPHAAELIALTNRPGSMASDPPASLSPVGQYNYRLGEGVAEWTRLLLTDPATVQNLQVSAAISAAAERFYPGMAKSLRDAARAVNAFQGQDVATRWAMFNAPPNVRPSANELVGAIIRGGEAAVNAIASGAPVSSLDRKITRAIIKQRKETETAYKAALTKARLVRSTNLTPLMSAYNMILSIGAETQLAISGTGTSKGLRIVEEDGSFRYLTHDAWVDLRKKVPAAKLAQFDQAAWAQESLNRWENGGLEYPGMREGILPEDLKAIVAMAVQDIPNFTRMYKEQSRFHDLILEIKEAGGLISGMDRARMQGARPGYWPLPRVMTAGRGSAGRGRGDMSAGVYRARGSGEAIRNIDEVTEERTREMFEAYYWNRFGLKLYDNMAAVAKDLSLPAEARILAGSTMVKMKMPMKAAASVSKEEALGWVMKSIGDAYEKVLGFRPEVSAEDVNLSWSFRDVWRPVKPTDVNVVSLLRDGVREYYQLGDPAIFGLFASPQTASKMGKAASWLLGPMTQNWKRNITQGAVFALRNLFRDTFTQTLLNPDPIGWVPGWAHTKGVVNKFTKKYPQVFSEGLLLSRVQPSEQEMLASIKHGAIWQWLSEGFYVSQAKDPVIKTVATVLQPSNWLFPIWKTADLINLVTGGRAMAAFFETAGREGAAVAALQRGATDEEALAKYWTASGQFNEHSGIADARIAMSVPGFLNPMLQGVRNVGQKLSDPDPAVRGTAWTRLLVMIPVMFGGAAIARYLMMDEDDKERERQRVVDDRLSFMDLAGFSVPFPYGPEGVMGSVVYNATMDDLLGRPKVDADRTAIMLLKRIVDPGSGLQFFGPQLATIMEANMNWSTFRQKPIVAPWMVQLPASEQYYSTTPEFYRKVGTMMNYSPAKLQYIVQQALSRQADETLRLAESIDRGRPMMEMADVPFVGRLFVRDPIGFGSQAVRSVTAVEDRLRLLDERLKAKGWNMLRDPEFPAEDLGSDQLRHLQVQLAYMEDLRKGMGVLSGMQGVAKYYSLKRDYANERNMRTVQTRYAQSLLIGNRGQIAELEKALELLKQIPQGSPDQVAAEYLDRRF